MKNWIIGAAAFFIAGVICTAGITKSLGGDRGGVVDAYYADAIQQDQGLKRLEKQIGDNKDNLYKLTSNYDAYDRLSSNYYGDATGKANAITDAALKSTVNDLINKSRSQYGTRVANLTAIIQTLKSRNITQEDYHLAVKIALTLPMIEEYQKEKLPADADYKALLKQLDVTIKELQDRAPK